MAFSDDYHHEDVDVYYVEENIPGDLRDDDPESSEIRSEFDSQVDGCACADRCVDSAECSCLGSKRSDSEPAPAARRGGSHHYVASNSESLLAERALGADGPIFECNSACECSVRCENRLVQFGPRRGLRAFGCRTEDGSERSRKGTGLLSARPVPKGGFVCEYAGEIISKSEAARRSALGAPMNYIMCVNEFAGSERKVQTFIDPSRFGNIGRYVNHSCDPNCVVVPVRVNTAVPKLCIFASREIEANAELTFDYGPSDRSGALGGTACLCGSDRCRLRLPSSECD